MKTINPLADAKTKLANSEASVKRFEEEIKELQQNIKNYKLYQSDLQKDIDVLLGLEKKYSGEPNKIYSLPTKKK